MKRLERTVAYRYVLLIQSRGTPGEKVTNTQHLAAFSQEHFPVAHSLLNSCPISRCAVAPLFISGERLMQTPTAWI